MKFWNMDFQPNDKEQMRNDSGHQTDPDRRSPALCSDPFDAKSDEKYRTQKKSNFAQKEGEGEKSGKDKGNIPHPLSPKKGLGLSNDLFSPLLQT